MRVLAPGPSCSSPDCSTCSLTYARTCSSDEDAGAISVPGEELDAYVCSADGTSYTCFVSGGKRPRAWGWRVVGRSVHTHRHTQWETVHTHTHTQWEAVYTHTHTHTAPHTTRPWTVTCQELGSKSINKRFYCDLVILVVLVCSLSATQINPPFWSPLIKGFIYQPDPSVPFVPANLLLLLLRTLI